MMNRFVNWLKNNTVLTLVIVVALASLADIAWVYSSGLALRKQMQERLTEAQRITSRLKTPVSIPSKNPDDPAQTVNIPVNNKAISELESAYNKMASEYERIFENALAINKAGHLPMIEGLFPDPGIENFDKPWDAKIKYKKALAEMLMPPSPAPTYPRLDATMPPSPDELKEAFDEVQSRYLNSKFPPKKLEELTPDEKVELSNLLAKRKIELTTQRAKLAHIYARTFDPDSNIIPADFPLQVDPWVVSSGRPPMDEIWEGQMTLWVQQDIVRAISMTNQTDTPGTDLVTSPIKRLVTIQVIPGYVGIDTVGGIKTQPPSAPNPPTTSNSTGGSPSTFSPTHREGYGGVSTAEASAAVSGDIKLKDDFSRSPTGRRSNTLYDVKHAWVVMDMDSQKLPAFFENLNRVNFQTCLKMRIDAIDEYEALQNGYLYAGGDVVRVSILIESIWLRDWTTPLMPKQTRIRLGIDKPEETTAQPTTN
ncbi:MAG: hypothetical protein GC164_04415 [Phycisphaera sp.]|nr:hypothetical protein [Phycisphaera sp.]